MNTTHANKRILLLEDDPSFERVLSGLIGRLNRTLEVTWIKSVHEAKTKLRNHEYDLVIADVFVEGDETGLDFWQQCEKSHPELPFILISSLHLNEFFDAIGPTATAPAFLPKPINLDDCITMIRKVFRAHGA